LRHFRHHSIIHISSIHTLRQTPDRRKFLVVYSFHIHPKYTSPISRISRMSESVIVCFYYVMCHVSCVNSRGSPEGRTMWCRWNWSVLFLTPQISTVPSSCDQ
jgi:hypothetical protein